MSRLERKHALATRIFHWANVPILAVMIYSGLLIYWANAVYAIRLGGITSSRSSPIGSTMRCTSAIDWPGDGLALHLHVVLRHQRPALRRLHGLERESRELVPNRQTFAEAWQVVLHDLGIRKQPLPLRKFNGAQRLAYTGVIAMGVGSLLTGLAIYKPVQVAWLTTLLGGYAMARRASR